jgi:hypothetical protein
MKKAKHRKIARAIQAAPVQLPAAPLTESQAAIAMIERAAKDPAIDVAKLKELIALKNAEQDRQAQAIYAAAMQQCQETMEPVRRDCINTQTRSRYASYEALDRALRPIYTKHGFGLSFSTLASGNPEILECTCKVMHRAGHSEIHQIPIPIVTKGPKGSDVMTPTHATMSAKTYGKRALLDMIFNVATTDVRMDDDGNAAGGSEVCSAEDIEALREAIKEAKLPMDKFEIAFGALDQLPAARLQEAQDRIKQFKQRGFQAGSQHA